ncbi:MAG: N-acetylmuramoyl-L-alanine amidase [Verrucomicrobiales bacterium]|nr:N-acetylmuramoyl-L-alanine amidase [Verrucomicrobiales bacterium]
MFNSKFLFYFLMPITLVAGSVMGQTIVIDPGHGGKSYLGTQKDRNMSSPNNAATPSGIKEKELTLAFSLELEKAILAEADKLGRKGVEVFLTRRDDVNLNFTERARFCAGKSPDMIISIHFNASKSGRGLGSLCVIRNSKINENFSADKKFADGLSEACNRAVRRFVPESKSIGSIEDGYMHGGQGSNFFFQMARYRNIREVPKCFLEIEHIDRKDVEEQLIKNRDKTFPVIAAEIASYLLNGTHIGTGQ